MAVSLKQWSLLLFLFLLLKTAHQKESYYGKLFSWGSCCADSFTTTVNQCNSIERIVKKQFSNYLLIAGALAFFLFFSLLTWAIVSVSERSLDLATYKNFLRDSVGISRSGHLNLFLLKGVDRFNSYPEVYHWQKFFSSRLP